MSGGDHDFNTLTSVISIIASAIAIYVTLYVRSHLGPIVTKIDSHEKRLDIAFQEEGKLWAEMSRMSSRIAHIEGASGGNKKS